MVVKAVILDFGGTLAEWQIDWDEYNRAIRRLLSDLGFNFQMVQLQEAIAKALDQRNEVRRRGEEMTLEKFYEYALGELGVTCNDGILTSIHDLFKNHYKMKVFPCVEGVLNVLSKRYKVALLSNTVSDKPKLILQQNNLSGYFKEIICSRDLGIRKPNPKIFQYVLKRLSVDPEEAVHVGDNIKDDMEGASNAGIIPIWIKRVEEKSWAGYAINSICDLPEFLMNLYNP